MQKPKNKKSKMMISRKNSDIQSDSQCSKRETQQAALSNEMLNERKMVKRNGQREKKSVYSNDRYSTEG